MSLNLNYKADVVVETENLNKEDWLNYRRQGIGGSDAAAIMGVSPFCTKRDLYYDKCGIAPAMDEEESNWVAKEVGHRLEDLVAEIFSKKTGLKVFPIRKMFRHPLYPFMLADVDYFIEFPDGSIGILECKTTNYNCQDKWANNSVPVNYEYQGRHYMSVMNINKVYFACLYGNNESEFIIRYMERDLEMEEDLIAEEEFFWRENVEKKEEPPYVEKPDLVLESIRKHFGPADKDAEQIKLPRKHLVSIQNYLELKEQKSKLDSEARKLEEKIKESYVEIVEELGVSCSGILKDGSAEYVVTYNPAYRTSIDKKSLERLKINHPDIYEDYVSVSESRRFAVKAKGAA
ncbi:MAG: YqaJ viral recombinase family protein [Lachnospiraceae bacterium]|nr:YqaJ viral recombinase family protein [Lachnospiraceae bacterium]